MVIKSKRLRFYSACAIAFHWVRAHYQLDSVEFNVLACGCFLDKRILPNLISIFSLSVMSGHSGDIDGKQVDFNDMIIVIVKCFNYSRMNGCESD